MSELEHIVKQLRAFLDWVANGGQSSLVYLSLSLAILALLICWRLGRRLKLVEKRLAPGSDSGERSQPVADGQTAEAEDKVYRVKLDGDAPIVEESTAEPVGQSVFSGLKKTRSFFLSRLQELLGGQSAIDSESYQGLEELLITSDLGVGVTKKLLAALEDEIAGQSGVSVSRLKQLLRSAILKILETGTPTEIEARKRYGAPLVVLVVGVNGVGKTTTIGKLAAKFKAQGAKVLVAACDTFRAAAVEQMDVWCKRVGVDIETGEPNAKPTTVAYQAVHRAKQGDYDVLLVDTAGRLHTRVNLMNELASVVRIIEREQPGSPHETLLVLDGSTGQNALQQAREFNVKTALSGIVITKLDGTPKGGIVVAICEELGIPIRYIGVGEGVADLKSFSANEFVDALLDDTAVVSASNSKDRVETGGMVNGPRRADR